MEKDFTKYWVGYHIESTNPQLKFLNYTIKNKILFYCFKNLSKSLKFKKRIGSTNYKFIKKTVQLYGNKNLILDFIFYLGIE